MSTTQDEENKINRDNQVEIGKIGEVVKSIKTDVIEIKRMLQQEYIRVETFKGLEKDVIEMQTSNLWLWRTVGGTIITIVVTALWSLLTK